MRLGLVTYNLAKDWDLDTLLRHCEDTGFEERTPHDRTPTALSRA